MREDLSVWVKVLERDFNKYHDQARQALTKWQSESELAGIREPIELEKMSAGEKAECQELWSKVHAVIESTSKPK